MTCSGYCEHIVETHSNISDYDRLDSCPECGSSFFSLFLVFMRSYLSIELPYYIEEEYGSHEFESWYLHEPDNSE